MLIADRDAYLRAATGAMLTGQPFETFVDACRRKGAEEGTPGDLGLLRDWVAWRDEVNNA